MLEKHDSISKLIASDVMTKDPVKIKHDILATDAIKIMNDKNINHLIVTEDSNFIGIVNVLDFIKEGIG